MNFSLGEYIGTKWFFPITLQKCANVFLLQADILGQYLCACRQPLLALFFCLNNRDHASCSATVISKACSYNCAVSAAWQMWAARWVPLSGRFYCTLLQEFNLILPSPDATSVMGEVNLLRWFSIFGDLLHIKWPFWLQADVFRYKLTDILFMFFCNFELYCCYKNELWWKAL